MTACFDSRSACLFLLPFLIGVWANSCRTTSPTATALRSAEAKSDEPLVEDKNDPTLGVLRWVVATRKADAVSEGGQTWSLDLKTDSEIWCEARCSKFELVEVIDGDTNELRVKKTAVVGNTDPGVLDIKREIKPANSRAKKIRLRNVGIRGQTVVLEEVTNKERPNFYAVPMTISSRLDGEKSVTEGTFAGESVEIRFEKGADLPNQVTRSSAAVEVFVLGSLVETTDANGKSSKVFWASKVLPPSNE